MSTSNLTNNSFFSNLDNLLENLSSSEEATLVGGRRGRGKDDAPGHIRRGRGRDDGPNHT